MGEIKSSNVPEPAHTIADGIAVTAPVPTAVERMKTLVDDIALVPDDALIEAMRLSASALGPAPGTSRRRRPSRDSKS